jgi:hypothetical protein
MIKQLCYASALAPSNHLITTTDLEAVTTRTQPRKDVSHLSHYPAKRQKEFTCPLNMLAGSDLVSLCNTMPYG